MKTEEIINIYKSQLSSGEGKVATLLDDTEFRNAIYDSLYYTLTPEDGPFIRDLFQREVQWLRGQSDEDSLINLYKCGLLLYRIGDVEDVLDLWRAKNITFDIRQRFEVQFLVGAGVDSTISFLRACDEDEAPELLNYILGCLKKGKFKEQEMWFEYRMLFVKPDISEQGQSDDSMYSKVKILLKRLF